MKLTDEPQGKLGRKGSTLGLILPQDKGKTREKNWGQRKKMKNSWRTFREHHHLVKMRRRGLARNGVKKVR